MKSNIIYTLLMVAVMILGSCTTKTKNATNSNDSIAAQAVTTVEADKNLINPQNAIAPHKVNAKFEGIHNCLNSHLEDLPDSIVTQLRNLEVFFLDDTITINGIKSTYSRRTNSTKNYFRQALPLQRFVFDYFGKKGINLNDSIDKLLVEYIFQSDWDKQLLADYSPDIIYERPYLLIPYQNNYCISFIVDIEPSEFNRLMPERRDQRK